MGLGNASRSEPTAERQREMTEIHLQADTYGAPLGAHAHATGTRFALWTSKTSQCAVRLLQDGYPSRNFAMEAEGDGFFSVDVPDVGHGARYVFVLDGADVRDPYATYLPDGVDAAAMVWQSSYVFKHGGVARPLREHVIYELHVGTFTTAGTYAAAAPRLRDLVELGITAIELMPIGAFPGSRGWGYDGVAHYAAFAPYGNPDELRAFVDEAHGLGLAVFLDVVYNHFGPAGNVLPTFGAEYFTAKHKTPWGDAPNFEDVAMRRYVVRNVRYWLEDIHFDGLRLDAVHEMADDFRRHILTEIAEEAARLSPPRLLMAEDDRNDPQIVESRAFDGVWADDFHHQVRVALTGEQDGYYAAYTGHAADLAQTIESGWFYRGAPYPLTKKPRGKEAPRLPAEAFIYCIQNHDQIGNRAFGDRFTATANVDTFAAATMLLLFLPMTPLLFMGQEWAATTPFLFFTDHAEELGRLVTEGRRKEFGRFAAFRDAATRQRIPDPQAETTFAESRLNWNERTTGEHARIVELYRALLRLRRSDPVLAYGGRESLRASADRDVLVVERWRDREVRRLVLNLGEPRVPDTSGPLDTARLLLTSAPSVTKLDAPMPKGTALLLAYAQRSHVPPEANASAFRLGKPRT